MSLTPSWRALRPLGQQHWPLWKRNPTVRIHGGLVHPGTLGEFERSTCGYFRYLFRLGVAAAQDRPYRPRFDNLSLFFLNTEKNNAIALEDQDRRGIGVNVGLTRNLWALVRLALGQSEFLAASFNSAPPESGFDPHSPQSWSALYGDPDGWPEDRSGYLFELFMYAAEFVVSHELAHHARAHMDYVRDAFGAACLDETFSLHAGRDSERGQLLQMLEFDADHHALELILRRQMKNGAAQFSHDEAETDAFRMMLSAILVFMAFDLDHRDIENHYGRSHPAPVHRAMRATSTIFFTYEHLFNLPGKVLQQASDDAWGEAAILAEKLRLPSGRWWGDGDLHAFTQRLRHLEADFYAFTEALDNRLEEHK